MKFTSDEINLLALSIAKCLNEKYDKMELIQIKCLLNLIISNLNSYL